MAIKYRLHGYESERGWGRTYDYSDFDNKEKNSLGFINQKENQAQAEENMLEKRINNSANV